MDTEAPPSSATPPDEQQKGKCLELVSGALARCPRVRELQQALEGLGSTVPIDCVQCPEGPDGNPAAAGGFLPDTNSVVLCQQWVTANPSEVCVCGCAQHLFFAPLGDEAVRPPPAQELGLPRVSCIAAFLLHAPTPLPYSSDTPPALVSPHDLPTISPRSPHGLPTVSPRSPQPPFCVAPSLETASASRVYLKLYLDPKVPNTLTHEYVHAFDHARAHIDWLNLTQHACTEIRAATLSGDCNFGRELDRANIHPLKIGGAGERCVCERESERESE